MALLLPRQLEQVPEKSKLKRQPPKWFKLHWTITKDQRKSKLRGVFLIFQFYVKSPWGESMTPDIKIDNNYNLFSRLSFIDNDKPTNGTVKAFMPIRRSERRPKKNQTIDIIQKLKEIGNDDSLLPLEVVEIPGKNRGVVPTKKLSKWVLSAYFTWNVLLTSVWHNGYWFILL